MLRKLIQAGAIIVLFTGPAFSQLGNSGNNAGTGINMNMLPDTRRHLTPEEQQREEAIEREYRETVNNKIPDKKGSNDPWGNVRTSPATSPASKQTAKQKQP